MNQLYHTRGWLRGLLRQPAWHLRESWRNPGYRALHRFTGQLARVPRHQVATVAYGGRPIRLADAASFLSAWDEIFVNRIYEIPARADARPPRLVDAGANIGLAALYWKHRYGNFAYLGFEPDPAIAGICRANLQAWDVGGELVEAAVAAEDKAVEFLPDRADGGRMIDGDAAPGGPAITVPGRRLSRYLDREVDLLKIDVEGAEAAVLQEIAPQLPLVRNLFVEWHGRSGGAGLGAAIELLESAGFDCYHQTAMGPNHPFMKPARVSGFTEQVNVFAVRP